MDMFSEMVWDIGWEFNMALDRRSYGRSAKA